jgi:hypothetical protein
MKKGSYLATGVIIGMALTITTPVLAETVKTVSAKINSTVDVVINGKETKLNAQPINYNNLNYLPVGEIGRALGLTVQYDKETDTINIDQKTESATNVTSTTTANITTQTQNLPIPTTEVGEKISNDMTTASIDKVEYVSTENNDGVVLKNGFKIYTTITNKSDSYNLRPVGGYQFKMESDTDQSIINNAGASYFIFTTLDGQKYDGTKTLEKNESATGFVFVPYTGNGKMVSVEYYPSYPSYVGNNKPMGVWNVK